MNSSSPIKAPSSHNWTPREVRHMILVHFLREGAGAAKGIPSTTLSNLSMYDPSITMPFATDTSLREDEGLQSILEAAAADNVKRKKSAQDVQYWITHPGAEEMRKSVRILLDKDITGMGLLKDNPGILQKPIQAKAICIVRELERKRLGIENLDDGHDFEIRLLTLIGGWGQSGQVELLYFKHQMSFPKFMNTLKDGTRHSKIPPENITMPTLAWPFDTPNSNNQSLNTASNTRDPNDKGYNLEDGPWMYRLPHVGKDTAPKPGWVPIRNENDYMNMLDGIKRVNSKYDAWGATERCSVVVMHSLDLECKNRYFENREQERAFSAEWEKELEEQGFFDGEEVVGNYGDDWYDAWSRSNMSPPRST